MPNDNMPIIDVILADINAVIPNFTSLVSSYRLLVGGAEEIRRTPGVPLEIFQRAVVRYDRAGTLIDVLLELLCCKIIFASQFLSTVCAPIDLPRYFTNKSEGDYTLQRTAEQIVLIEALRLLLTSLCEESPCFGPPPPNIGCPPIQPICPTVPASETAPPKESPAAPQPADKDAQSLISEVTPILITDISESAILNPVPPSTSTITRPDESSSRKKHYQKGASINKKNKQSTLR